MNMLSNLLALEDSDLFINIAMGLSDLEAERDLKETPVQSPARALIPRTSKKPVMSPSKRRRCRLDREQRRLKDIKKRIESFNRDASELLAERNKMIERWLAMRDETLDHLKELDAGLHPTPRDANTNAISGASIQRYVALVAATDHLEKLNGYREEELQRHRKYHSAVQAALTALHGPSTPHADPDPANPTMDPIALFQAMLTASPVTPDDALDFVRDTCRDMEEVIAQTNWGNKLSGFGFSQGSGSQLDDDGSKLRFRISHTVQSVTALHLMQNTWTLLTRADEYRRLQPATTRLQVLQRVNDESWVVGIVVGGDILRHGMFLVARVVVDGGYVVTFHSLPLERMATSGSDAKRLQFVLQETGGIYVNTFSWYRFHEQPNASGGVDCDVTFGGLANNLSGERRYLKLLQLEVPFAFARWQSAVGVAPQMLPLAANTDDDGGGQRDTKTQ